MSRRNMYVCIAFCLATTGHAADEVRGQPSVNVQDVNGTPKKQDYRYDGKTFAEWRTHIDTDLRNELKAERRVTAINAVTVFRHVGYETEAAAAIMQVVRDQLRTHFDGKVAAAATEALMATPSASTPHLVEGLRSENSRVRAYCKNLLLERTFVPDPTTAIPALMDIILGNKTESAEDAICVLHTSLVLRDGEYSGNYYDYDQQNKKSKKIAANVCSAEFKKEGRAAALVKALIAHVEAKKEDVGDRAVAILGAMGDWSQAAVPTLLRTLEKEGRNRGEVMKALGYIATDEDKVVPALARMLEAKTEATLVMKSLSCFEKRGKPATPALVKCLSQTDLDRCHVISALFWVEADPEQVIPPLLDAMAKTDYRASRRGVKDGEKDDFLTFGLAYLVKRGAKSKHTVPGIVKIITGIKERAQAEAKAEEVKAAAARKANPKPMIPDNQPTFGFPPFGPSMSFFVDGETMRYYVDALGEIGPMAAEALPLLKDLAQNGSDAQLRAAAAAAIKLIEDEDED